MGLSEFWNKTFKDPTTKAKEAGQAVLEYILVLVITVSIILGLMYQFNDAFKQFLDSYFGDYIACLLESGELPALGGAGANAGQCASPYSSFDVANGATLDTSYGNSPNSSRANGSSGDSSNARSNSSSTPSGSRSSPSLRPSRQSSSGSTSNAEATVSSSRGDRPARQSKNIIRSDSGKNGGFDSNSTDASTSVRRGRRITRSKIIYLEDGYGPGKEKKKNKNPVIATGRVRKGSGVDFNLRKAKFRLQVPEQRKVAGEVKMDSMSLGDILKYLIIGGIIIVLFLFLGGQAMQIKKSWQKAE